jgi:hypothetical protein
MSQTRNKTGTRFEKEICEKFGWEHSTKSPRINWIGYGSTNLEKMYNHYINGTCLKIDVEKSIFEKWDAIDNDKKIEIKKYNTSECLEWTLYSEPFIKIASKSAIENVTNLLGRGDSELGRTVYNEMIEKSFKENKDILLEKITKSNNGIRFKDKFVERKFIEFRMVILKGWREYNRATIQFRIVDKPNDKKTKRTFIEWITGIFS